MCQSCAFDTAKYTRGFTSWSAFDKLHFDTPVQSNTQLLRLAGMLQGRYSEALYGSRGLVPTDGLRIVWLSLLPANAIAWLSQIGVCGFSTIPPLIPFFSAPDAVGGGNQMDAVWIHNDALVEGFPNNSWVEVTHCAQNLSVPPKVLAMCDEHEAAKARNASVRPLTQRSAFSCGMSRAPGKWQWRAGNMWFFVAPGSGVSINIGRTRVFESFAQAQRFLERAVQWDGSRAWDGCRAALVNETGEGAALDSIQILRHREYYSRELRHEIVMLRHGECETLTPSTPFAACGRPPHMQRCTSAALDRISRCAFAAHVRKAHKVAYPGLQRDCEHLDEASGGRAACYHNGSTYLCNANVSARFVH